MKKNLHTALSILLALTVCHSASATTATHDKNAENKLNKVPPTGLDSLDQAGLTYYQEMGPLEFAARLLPAPAYPGWRLHFTLQPNIEPKDQILNGYTVNAERINLSPVIYAELVATYDEENADPAYKDVTPSDRHTLPFAIVQSVTADFLADTATHSHFDPLGKPCALQADCGAAWLDKGGDWGNEKIASLEAGAWPQDNAAVPELVRALAKQAGWLQKNDAGLWQWVTPEMPEGLSAERPWVEITVDSHAGNGGGLLADWVEHVNDDSIRARLTRIIQLADSPKLAIAYQANLCARGDTDKPAQSCP